MSSQSITIFNTQRTNKQKGPSNWTKKRKKEKKLFDLDELYFTFFLFFETEGTKTNDWFSFPFFSLWFPSDQNYW